VDKNWEHLRESKPQLVSIMIGTNDLKSGTTIRDFEIAFSLLVLKARLLVGTKHIVLNKIPLLHKGVMLPYNSGMNETVHDYNNLIDRLAKREGLHLNTMPQAMNFFIDGVHLNNDGSRKWGETLANLILDLRNAD
jgi:lysophospholipase L1-like esterase